MPRFEPFPGIRYDPARVDLDAVVAPPYDVLSSEDRAALAGRDPHNVVLVDVPDEAPRARAATSAAGATFRQWLADGVLVADREPRLLPLAMTFTDEAGAARTIAGVLGALAVTDPDAPGNDVLPHEQTTPKASTDRLDLTRATAANLSPIWGLSLAATLAERTREPGERLASVTDDDGVVHQLDRIDDPARVEAIHAAVASAPGAHRRRPPPLRRGPHLPRTSARAAGRPGRAPATSRWPSSRSWPRTSSWCRPSTGWSPGSPDGIDLAGRPGAVVRGGRRRAGHAGHLAAMHERGALCLVAPDGTGRFLVPRAGAFDGVARPRLGPPRPRPGRRAAHQLAFQHGVPEVLAELHAGRAQWACCCGR